MLQVVNEFAVKGSGIDRQSKLAVFSGSDLGGDVHVPGAEAPVVAKGGVRTSRAAAEAGCTTAGNVGCNCLDISSACQSIIIVAFGAARVASGSLKNICKSQASLEIRADRLRTDWRYRRDGMRGICCSTGPRP